MSAGPDPRLDASRVAAELEAIFADTQPPTRIDALGSRVRTVASRRTVLPYATLGAVAAAALVGLSAGTLMARGRVAPPAKAPPTPVRALPVQVAAPTVTLPTANQGPIPVLDDAPVAAAKAVRPAVLRRHAAAHRHARPGDLMAADRRLRAAYSHAVSAGVPRHVLAAYRDRWADLRDDASWRPDRVAAGYGAMTTDLERLARHSHGRQPPAPRYRLFDFFS